MNTKRLLVLAGGMIILVLFGWLALRYFGTKSPAPIDPVDDPFGGIATTSTSPTEIGSIIIKNADGTSVTVSDFTKGKTPLEGEGDTYYDLIHEGPLFGDEDDAFGVQYQSSNSYFLVSILKEPLSSARSQAETFLRTTLNLSNEQLCRLNLSVIVTTDINSVYADKGDLRLSFCPGAIPLP